MVITLKQYRLRCRHLKQKYGITFSQHQEMIKAQEGKCAICGTVGIAELAIDHDHNTGRVRGLLCRRCNTGLGCFRDNPRSLKAAIEYLKRSDD
jgi:hypothetical protein